MATIALQACRPVSTISGNTPELKHYPEAASQTFKVGEPVYLNGGYVTECGDDPTTILGIAAADGSNATSNGDNNCAVWVANDDTYFCANIYHGTVGSAVTAVTDVDTDYGLIRDTANSKMYVDKADVVATRLTVCKLDARDVVGDTYGRVWFKFLEANRQFPS